MQEVIKYDVDKSFYPGMGVKLKNKVFLERVVFGLKVFRYVDQLKSGWPMLAFLLLQPVLREVLASQIIPTLPLSSFLVVPLGVIQ